jgi:hypothetical protein
MTYRTGRHLGRTVYRVNPDGGPDELIGVMDEPYLGEMVVEALNARERVLSANQQVGGRAAVPPGSLLTPSTCGRVGMHNCGILGRWMSHDSAEPQAGGPLTEVRDESVPQTCQDSQGRPVDTADCELNGPHYATQGSQHMTYDNGHL